MTLLELLRLLRTKLVFVIALPVICAVVCLAAAEFLVQPTYSATSSVVTNASFGIASGFATSAATEASTDSVKVTSTATSSTATLSFAAEGTGSQACVDAANDAAQATKDKVAEVSPDAITEVTEATSAKSAGHGPRLYAVVAFLAGLFVAIVIVVIQDMVVRKVHDWGSVETAAQLRYLGTYGGDAAQKDRLAVAVRLAGRTDDKMNESVCLVPVGRTNAAQLVARQLNATRSASPLDVVAARPLAEGASAILDARKAQSCVLVVQAETSTFGDLETVTRELDVADVKPAGFVYVDAAAAKQATKQVAKPKHG